MLYVKAVEDLDDILVDEIVENIVQDLRDASEDYPLAARGKWRKFHRNFREFWRRFVDHQCEKDDASEHELYDRLIEWFTTLSRFAISHAAHSPVSKRELFVTLRLWQPLRSPVP